jgi:hypothetical protein
MNALRALIAKLDRRKLLIGVIVAAVACVLLSHRSTDAFIFIYSLPYFIFLVLCAIASIGFGIMFWRFGTRAWFLIAAIAIPLIVIAVLLEAGGQLYAWYKPSYHVLCLQPDRHIGWKQVPNMRYTWTGPSWAAHEFSAPVEINSEGFRDREHTIDKPRDVIRIALLGDSFVEGLQVPLEHTASGLLESRLNRDGGELVGKTGRFEVLNFGISNFGLGQYLLTWETYARKYAPDYLFAFVAEFHMRRAVSEFTSSSQGRHKLAVTPTFRLVDDKLVVEPARDFDKFLVAQRDLIQNEFQGSRILRRSAGLFVWKILDRVCGPIAEYQRTIAGAASPPRPSRVLTPEEIEVNRRILQELGTSARLADSRLIIVDVIQYFGDNQDLSDQVKDLCAENELGYLDLSSHLLRENRKGVKTRWRYDGHFNRAGHEIFANAMYNWLVKNESHPHDDGR